MSEQHPARVSGHQDPAGEAPWAMPIVVRVEKLALPTHTAVCEAAARAVSLLLTDDRSQPGGEWAAAIERWEDGRIRKVVRRARSAKWVATAVLPHVEIEHAGASVRAFVPGPTDQVPAALAKLQVSGLDLAADAGDAGDARDAGDAAVNAVEAADRRDDEVTPPPHALAVSIALTPHVRLTTGKAAAQCAHAAQLAARRLDPERLHAWVDAGSPVHLTFPDEAAWADLVRCAPVRVTDAGFTEIPPGTDTTLAWW